MQVIDPVEQANLIAEGAPPEEQTPVFLEGTPLDIDVNDMIGGMIVKSTGSGEDQGHDAVSFVLTDLEGQRVGRLTVRKTFGTFEVAGGIEFLRFLNESEADALVHAKSVPAGFEPIEARMVKDGDILRLSEDGFQEDFLVSGWGFSTNTAGSVQMVIYAGDDVHGEAIREPDDMVFRKA